MKPKGLAMLHGLRISARWNQKGRGSRLREPKENRSLHEPKCLCSWSRIRQTRAQLWPAWSAGKRKMPGSLDFSRRKMCWSTRCGAGPPHGRAFESICNTCLKIFDHHKKRPTPTMIPRGNGVSEAKNRRARTSRNRANGRKERLRPTPAAGPLRVARKCSLKASCPISSGETVPCDESDLLACDHKRLRSRVRDATVPRTNLFPDSTGSVRQACAWGRRPELHQPLPKLSTDDSPAHLYDRD